MISSNERSNQLTGFLFAFFSTITLSGGYMFSKAALNHVDLFHFGFYWFGFATIWNFIFIFKIRKKINLSSISRKGWLAILGNTFCEVVGSSLFYIAIQQMENPAIVSFFVNMGAVFILILGYFFLKERFNPIEYFGIGITIFGVFLINYHTDSRIAGSSITGVWLIVGSTFFIALAIVIAKKAVKSIQPVILTTGRIVTLFLISFLFLITNNESFAVPASTIVNTLLGSFMGPFLALLSSYYALKYIEASFVTVISSTKGFFLVILTYFVFSIQISHYQLLGGLATIVGIILISIGKRILKLITNNIIKKANAEIS